jgi:hypothetical protein
VGEFGAIRKSEKKEMDKFLALAPSLQPLSQRYVLAWENKKCLASTMAACPPITQSLDGINQLKLGIK